MISETTMVRLGVKKNSRNFVKHIYIRTTTFEVDVLTTVIKIIIFTFLNQIISITSIPKA